MEEQQCRRQRRQRTRRCGLIALSISVVSISALITSSVAERAYPLGCSQQPPTYYNYDNYPFPPPGTLIGSTADYMLVRRLGSGKFSDVFEAVDGKKEQTLIRSGLQTMKSPGDVDPRTVVVLKVSLSRCLHL